MIVAALALVVMLSMLGFVMDFGKAYLVQRQLQASVDAAALAGAQQLPDATESQQAAQDYSGDKGEKNAVGQFAGAVTTTVTMRCVKQAPGCSPTTNQFNAVRVQSSSSVGTTFARLLGIKRFTVHATATACSPCSAKPLDIAVVLDRTGSMCQFSNGQNDPACTDLTNARNGIETFLGFMDPTIDMVSLSVLPPAINAANPCQTPASGTKNYGYDAWWPNWVKGPGKTPPTPSLYTIASMQFNYLVQSNGSWILNPSSNLVQMLGCVHGAGTTAFVQAVDEAQHELVTHGRGNVQNVMIFLSDGAANQDVAQLPSYMDTSLYHQHPCLAGIRAAQNAKDNGTIVFTIGYDLNGLGTDPEQCKTSSGAKDTITSYDTIKQMASDPSDFYNKPDPGQLNTIFTRIAADLSRPASRLIDNNTP